MITVLFFFFFMGFNVFCPWSWAVSKADWLKSMPAEHVEGSRKDGA